MYTYDAAKHLDDARGGVLTSSLDPCFAAEITVWGADPSRPTWMLLGVDEDNWWNQFVPDNVQTVCSGSRLLGLEMKYFLAVMNRYISKPTDLVNVVAGILARGVSPESNHPSTPTGTSVCERGSLLRAAIA